MRRFSEWLLERQMMMFSTKPVEVYHGTYTGKDDRVLASFRTKGVLPNLASGYGQGHGFYVWSDKKSAANHTNAIANDPMVSTGADLGGAPMIVTIEAIMEPEKWDLDYEMNHEKMIDWLHDNHEMANEIAGAEGVRIANRFSREIPAGDDRMVMSKGVQFKEPSGSRSTHYAKGKFGGMRAGELVGSIMNRIQQKDAATIHRFEELFFANMGPGVAVKYVGSEPLKPKRIEVFRDGQWVKS
jgi:hypothetical protein